MKHIPPSWAESIIGECFVEVRNGTTFTQNTDGKGLPVSRIETIQNAQFDLSRIQHIDGLSSEAVETFRYQPGDIAFNHINSYEHVGKTALYDGKPEIFIHGMNLLRMRLGHDHIDPRFAHLFMQTRFFREEVRQRVGHAVNQVSINQKNLAEVPIVVAPLAEQRRIVAKLETILAKVDACQDRLAKIPTILKRFRQSVLAAACSGRLTADWRQGHPELQPVTHVLERLAKSRLANSETVAQNQRLRAIFEHPEANDSGELPEAWRYVALDKVCESFNYGTSAKSQAEGTIPVLRMGNIQNGEVDWSDLVYTSDEKEIAKYRLTPNTVLFNRTNSPELVGKTALYRGERAAIFAGYLIRVNPFHNILLPDYLNYSLNTMYARDYCLQVKSDGVSQSNINAQKLGKFEVPLPPFAEQYEIVRRVDSLFRVADVIETRFTQAQEQVDKLTPSLLAKAFRGELVPTEADLAKVEGRGFESAEELLKRIVTNSNGAAAPRPARANRRTR